MDCFADVLFERCHEYWTEQVVVKFEGGNIAVPIILHKQKAPRVVSDVDEGVFQYSDLSVQSGRSILTDPERGPISPTLVLHHRHISNDEKVWGFAVERRDISH
jgi:hypothetical protein